METTTAYKTTSERVSNEGLCLDEYSDNEGLANVHFQRAVGELPEMECAKATAAKVAELAEAGDSVLDVGCGAGHYLRSFKTVVSSPFSYAGVDNYPLFLEKAKQAWSGEEIAEFRLGNIFDLPVEDGEFDLTICSNLLMHLPTIVKPLEELIRATKRTVIVRTLIAERAFRIQEVLSSKWWPYTDIAAEDELLDSGEPQSFSYENIYSFDYFTATVKRFAPGADVQYVKDEWFSAENIERSADTEGLVNATRIVDGQQVFGQILLPYHFAIINI